MIGKAALGVHPEQADQDHAGTVEPMPIVIIAPRTKFPASPTPNLMPESASASPPPGSDAEVGQDEEGRGRQQRHAHPDLDVPRAARPPRPAPSQTPPRPPRSAAISVTGATVTSVMKMNAWVIVGSACPMVSVPGIRSSGTRPPELEQRGGRRKGPDAEGIEEVGDESDERLQGGGHPGRVLRCGPGAEVPGPGDDETHGDRRPAPPAAGSWTFMRHPELGSGQESGAARTRSRRRSRAARS